MTKAAMLEEMKNLLESRGMNDYLTVFKLKYPNSYKRIIDNGNWLTHYFNRFYVYSTAKMILA